MALVTERLDGFERVARDGVAGATASFLAWCVIAFTSAFFAGMLVLQVQRAVGESVTGGVPGVDTGYSTGGASIGARDR